MTLNKKHCLIFLAVLIILMMSMTIASATNVNDANNTQAIQDNNQISTQSHEVDNMVQTDASKTSKGVQVEKKNITDNQKTLTNNTHKQITKKTEINNQNNPETQIKEDSTTDVTIDTSFVDLHQQVAIGVNGNFERDINLYVTSTHENVKNGTLNVGIEEFGAVHKSFSVVDGIAHVLVTHEELLTYHDPNHSDGRDVLYLFYVSEDDSYKSNVAASIVVLSQDVSQDDLQFEITEYNKSIFVGENVTIKGNVSQKTGESGWIDGEYVDYTEPLAGLQVTLIANDKITSVTTYSNGSGEFELNFSDPSINPGSGNIFLNFKLDGPFTVDKYFLDSEELSVDVKGHTNITINAGDINVGQPVTISGQVIVVENGNNAQVSSTVNNKRFNITINDETPVSLKISKGKYSYTYTPTETEFKVTVSWWNGNKYYLGSTNSTTFRVSATNTNMTIENNKTIKLGQKVDITGILSTESGNVIKNTVVDIKIGDKPVENVEVNSSGKYFLSQELNELGEIPITVIYTNHTSGYKSSTNTSTVNVLPRDTNMTIINNETILVGQQVTINGTLIDELNNIVKSTYVNITVGNTPINNVPVNEEGFYESSCPIDEVGEINITVKYISDNVNYTNSINTSKVYVLPRSTNMTVNNNETILAGQEVTIKGILTDQLGEIVKNRVVTIKVGDDTIPDVQVDEEGNYIKTHKIDNIGSYIITVTYTNDTTNYTSSTNTSEVIVNPRNTHIVFDDISPVYIGQNAIIRGTLYDQLDEIVSDTTLTVRIDKNYINEEVTVDIDGKFELQYSATSVGEHTINVTYINDTTRYINSTNTSKYTVNPLTTNMTILHDGPIRVGSDLTVSGYLTDVLGQKVTDTTVTVKVGTKSEVVSVDGNGYYEQKFILDATGTYDIIVEYVNDTTKYVSSTNTSSYTLEKIPTVTNVTIVNDKLYNVSFDVTVSENTTKFDSIIESGRLKVTVGDKSKEYVYTGANTRIVLDDTVNITTVDEVLFKVEYVSNDYYTNSTAINMTNGEMITKFTARPLESRISVYVKGYPYSVDTACNIYGQVFDEYGNIIKEGIVILVFNNDTDNYELASIQVNSTGGYEYNHEHITSIGGLNNVTVIYMGSRTTSGNILINTSSNATSYKANKINVGVRASILNSTFNNVTLYINITNSSYQNPVMDFVKEGSVRIKDYDSKIVYDIVTLSPTTNPGEVNITLPFLENPINRIQIEYVGTDVYDDGKYLNITNPRWPVDYLIIELNPLETKTTIKVIDPDNGEEKEGVLHGQKVNIIGNVTTIDDEAVPLESVDIDVYIYNLTSGENIYVTTIEDIILDPGEYDPETGEIQGMGSYNYELDTTGLINDTDDYIIYNFIARYNQYECLYNQSQSSPAILVITKLPSKTNVEKIISNKSGEVTLRINVTDNNGQLLSTGHVIVFNASDASQILGEGDIDEQAGKVDILLNDVTEAGDILVNVTFTGNSMYTSSNALGLNAPRNAQNTTRITVTVDQVISISPENSVMLIGDTLRIQGEVLNSTGGMSDLYGRVILLINGQESTVEFDCETGCYAYTFEADTYGNYTVNATYVEYGNKIVTSKNIYITVYKINSTTKIEVLNSTAGNVTLLISVEGKDGNKSMTGKVNITIEGNKVVPLTLTGEETIQVNLKDNITRTGNISVIVEYAENYKYYSSTATTQVIEVLNQTSILTVNVDNNDIINSTIVKINGTLTDDQQNKISDSYVEILVNDKFVGIAKTDKDGKYEFEYTSIEIGENTVNVTYAGDNKRYSNATNNSKFNVYKLNTSIELKVTDTQYNKEEVINITLDQTSATGKVIVKITSNNQDFTTLNNEYTYNGEKIQINLDKLPVGKYTVTATYSGDSKYNTNTTTKEFKVEKVSDYTIKVTAQNITYDNEEKIIVTLPDDAKSIVTVNITGRSPETINLKETNTIIIPAYTLNAGNYEVNISYTDDNYILKTNTTTFNVSKIASHIKVTPTKTTVGYNETITITLPEYEHATGNISVKIIKDENTVKEYIIECPDNLHDDKNITIITKLEEGKYKILVQYTNDTNLEDSTDNAEFTVTIPTITIYKSQTTDINEEVTIHGTVKDNNNNINEGKILLNIGTKTLTISLEEYEKGYITTFDKKGEYTVNATYILEDKIVTSKNIKITVNKIPAILTVEATSPVETGNKTMISGKLSDKTDNPIKEAKIVVKVDNVKVGQVTTDKDGLYTFEFNNTLVGTHNVNCNYDESNTYIETSATTNFIVTKQKININIDTPENPTLNDETDITGKITSTDNKAIVQLPVTIKVNNKTYTTQTDKNGNFKIENIEKQAGQNIITVTAGNNSIETQTKTDTFKTIKINTTISIKPTKDTISGQNTTITGKLTDKNNQIIPNAKVTITMDNISKTVITDNNGEYKTQFPTDTIGQKTIIVEYNGNDTYNPSNTQSTLKIIKNNATATINKPTDAKAGQTTNITGTLKDTQNKPIANTPIKVTVNGKTQTAITDANGNYHIETDNIKNGENTVTVTSQSDKINIKSTSTKFNATKISAISKTEVPKDAKAGQTTNITGTLKDTQNKPIANTPIKVTVNGKTLTAITDENGNYNIETDNIKNGENTVTVSAESDTVTANKTTTKFNATKPVAKVTLNNISDTSMDTTPVITGKLVDDNNKALKDAVITVKVNDEEYKVFTDKNGSFVLENPKMKSGLNNVTVSYDNDEYDTTPVKTTFISSKVKTRVIVESITGTIGEDITLIAHVLDDNNNKVNGGNLVFKLNGRTLRSDGRFDTNNTSPLKLKVVNGIVTHTIKADLYLRAGKNITASYSGSNVYESAKANIAKAEICKRSAQVIVSITPTKAIQNKDITFTATLKDITKNATNKECLTTDADIVFKVNGVSLKDTDAKVKHINVTSSVVNMVYHIPTGMGGVDANGVKNYTVEAVYNNQMFYPNVRNSSVFHVQRSIVNINFIKTSVKSNVLSVKATLKDYENNNLIGTNKVCVKINGKTYQENGKAKYFKVIDGKVDLTGIKVQDATKVKSVMLVTGEREGYLGARSTTNEIIVN